MDKLRAIQYFNRAVEMGSFSAAARSLAVSTPALTQLVGALERSLGITLVHRSPRGLSLTPDGERYYRTSQRLVADLRELEQQLGPGGAKPRGTLTVGMRQSVAEHCVMPRIGRFLARFPDVELLMRGVRTEQIETQTLDVGVMVGWPPKGNLIARHLAQTRHVVCASASYWAAAGKPQHPAELKDHHCLVFRNDEGMLVDRWSFTKDDEQCSVDVRTRLLSDNRSWLDAAALAGAGVMRVTDLTSDRYFTSGLLVPVLTDWHSVEAPTIYAVYARAQRRSKLVRAFIDFLSEVFADLERERVPGPATTPTRVAQPRWFGHDRGRLSARVAHQRSSR
jgi:LysR family transcriptional regulator, regulator for bpeEF and oprC